MAPSGAEASEFDLVSLVAGYLVDLPPRGAVESGLGFRASLSLLPETLEPFYGTRGPAGFMAFIRLAPSARPAGAGHHGGGMP